MVRTQKTQQLYPGFLEPEKQRWDMLAPSAIAVVKSR